MRVFFIKQEKGFLKHIKNSRMIHIGTDVIPTGTEKKILKAKKKRKISPNFGDSLSSDGNPAISYKLW